MNWADILTIVIAAIIVIVFTLRGREYMGAALFDTVALVLTAYASHKFYLSVSGRLGIPPALAYIALFAIIGVLLIFLSAKLHETTQWNFHPINGLLSFAFGIVAAWAVAYALLDCIVVGAGLGSDTAYNVQSSTAYAEIVQFRSLVNAKEKADSTTLLKPGD